jgi:hypothetical protein
MRRCRDLNKYCVAQYVPCFDTKAILSIILEGKKSIIMKNTEQWQRITVFVDLQKCNKSYNYTSSSFLHKGVEYKHRRVLEIYLRLVEKHLRGINDSLMRDCKNSIYLLYSINNNIDVETQAKMHNMLLEMLDEIAKLKEKFNLESEEIILRRTILGHLTEIWTTLEELRPEKIEKGHGKISEPDKAILNPRLTKLLLLANESFTIFK